MNPSSAMALVSAGVMSAARTVVSASTGASAETRIVFVFIVPLMIVCRPTDTVGVSYTLRRNLHPYPLGICSSIELWDSILVGLAFIYHVLLATPGTARGTGVGHGSSGHPDDVDEQGTSSPISRRSAFKDARV